MKTMALALLTMAILGWDAALAFTPHFHWQGVWRAVIFFIAFGATLLLAFGGAPGPQWGTP